MTEALLNGRLVELIGEVYEGPKTAPGRQWTMVRECGTKTWKPAWMDELKELSKEMSDDD